MTERNQVWKCEVCGNVVEVLHEGAGVLVCCGKPMVLMEENVVDASEEHRSVSPELQSAWGKHIPVLKNGAVQVGSVLHPMEEEHYIEWIEVVLKNGRIIRKFLKPGDEPVLSVCCDKVASVRAYCNLHGLWANSNF